MPFPDDAYILALFQEEQSREKAFNLLIAKYQQEVYYAVRKYVYLHEDADDVTQNVFVKIWRHLGAFRQESSLKTWITRICINESLSFIEQKKRLVHFTDEKYSEHILQVAAQENYFSAEHIEQLINAAILQLPHKQRIIFTMRYYDEIPYEEMSKILNTSVNSLKASYHFAYKKVEAFLKKSVDS